MRTAFRLGVPHGVEPRKFGCHGDQFLVKLVQDRYRERSRQLPHSAQHLDIVTIKPRQIIDEIATFGLRKVM